MNIISRKAFGGLDERNIFAEDIVTASKGANFRITEGGHISKIKFPKLICSVPITETIDAVWCGSIKGIKSVFFVSGGILNRIAAHQTPKLIQPIGEVGDGECMMFDFGGMLYIKSENRYCRFNGDILEDVEGYIPCVAISCSPSGEGELLEQINLICDKRRQLFSGDGTAVYYHLAEKNVDSVISIKIDGIDYPDRYSLNSEIGTISFEKPPEAGLNNVEIIYSKANTESDRQRIFGCRKIMLFGGNSDGRAFLWGNDKFPNYRFHSDLAGGVPSVEYFPVNAFTVIGNGRITCIAQQYDRQLIFSENKAFYSYCELRDDGLGNTYSSFPVYSLNGSKGCLFETDGCIIDNRPVTLCDDGLNVWESTSVENEKNAVCISSPIERSMRDILNSGDKKYMFDFQAHRELFFVCGHYAYVYNYGNKTWYKYTNFSGRNYAVIDSRIYFSKDNCLYSFSYDDPSDTDSLMSWISSYMAPGQAGGCEVVGIEFDMETDGKCELVFTAGGEGQLYRQRKIAFEEAKRCRLSFRTRIKRAIPFRMDMVISGTGNVNIYGLTLKIRKTERSSRNGLQ